MRERERERGRTGNSGYAYSDKKKIAAKTTNLNKWTGNSTLEPKAKAPTTVE